MKDHEKGLMFYWHRSDFILLRLLIALICAGGLFFLLSRILLSSVTTEQTPPAIPLSSHETRVISREQLLSGTANSDYLLRDPFQLRDGLIRKAEGLAAQAINTALDTPKASPTPYKAHLRPVPYTPPQLNQETDTIIPSLPSRELIFNTNPAQRKDLDVKIFLSQNLPKLRKESPTPHFDLGANTSLNFSIKVSPSGEVQYCIPHRPSLTSKKLTRCLEGLLFYQIADSSQGLITLELVTASQ